MGHNMETTDQKATGIITLPTMSKAEVEAFKYGWTMYRELQAAGVTSIEVQLKFNTKGLFGLDNVKYEKIKIFPHDDREYAKLKEAWESQHPEDREYGDYSTMTRDEGIATTKIAGLEYKIEYGDLLPDDDLKIPNPTKE
jgi:hypothetical protein